MTPDWIPEIYGRNECGWTHEETGSWSAVECSHDVAAYTRKGDRVYWLCANNARRFRDTRYGPGGSEGWEWWEPPKQSVNLRAIIFGDEI